MALKNALVVLWSEQCLLFSYLVQRSQLRQASQEFFCLDPYPMDDSLHPSNMCIINQSLLSLSPYQGLYSEEGLLPTLRKYKLQLHLDQKKTEEKAKLLFSEIYDFWFSEEVNRFIQEFLRQLKDVSGSSCNLKLSLKQRTKSMASASTIYLIRLDYQI